MVTLLAALALAGSGARVPGAFGHPVGAEGGAAVCATIRGHGGSAQILDENRTRIHEVGEIDQVPCGGWVSVDDGWVRLEDRLGHELRLGAASFAQLTEGPIEVILFRGQMYGRASRGALRVITPNARAIASGGSMLVLFDPRSETSQVVALAGAVEVENRFEKSHRTRVGPGTLSEVSFRHFRILPRSPRPVAPESLVAKLGELRVPMEARETALHATRLALARSAVKVARIGVASEDRSPQRSPAGLVFDQNERAGDDEMGGGKLASGASRGAAPSRLGRGAPSRRLERQVVGGDHEGIPLLFPASPDRPARHPARAGAHPHSRRRGIAFQASSPRVSSRMPDPEAQETAEKRKLIEELSTIQTE